MKRRPVSRASAFLCLNLLYLLFATCVPVSYAHAQTATQPNTETKPNTAPLPNAEEPLNPDELEINHYVLKIERVREYRQVFDKFSAATESDPTIRAERQEVSKKDAYAVEKARMIDAECPRMRELITQNGFTAREFIFLPLTLLTAEAAADAEDEGLEPGDFINPVNITFVREHVAELKELQLRP